MGHTVGPHAVMRYPPPMKCPVPCLPSPVANTCHRNTRYLTPDTRDLRPVTRHPRPVATGTPVDPVVRMSHGLSRSQSYNNCSTGRHR